MKKLSYFLILCLIFCTSIASANVTIKLRGDTSANWELVDPVLAEREPGIETDTNRLKIGDGVSIWSVLPYVSGDKLSKDGITAIGMISMTGSGEPGDPFILEGLGPYVVQTTAPENTDMFWVDSSEAPWVLKFYNSTTPGWEGISGVGGEGLSHAVADGGYYVSKDGVWEDVSSLLFGSSVPVPISANQLMVSVDNAGILGWEAVDGLNILRIRTNPPEIGDAAGWVDDGSGNAILNFDVPAAFTIGTDIGDVVGIVDDGLGNPSLGFTLDIGDLTDAGGLLTAGSITIPSPCNPGDLLVVNSTLDAAECMSLENHPSYIQLLVYADWNSFAISPITPSEYPYYTTINPDIYCWGITSNNTNYDVTSVRYQVDTGGYEGNTLSYDGITGEWCGSISMGTAGPHVVKLEITDNKATPNILESQEFGVTYITEPLVVDLSYGSALPITYLFQEDFGAKGDWVEVDAGGTYNWNDTTTPLDGAAMLSIVNGRAYSPGFTGGTDAYVVLKHKFSGLLSAVSLDHIQLQTSTGTLLGRTTTRYAGATNRLHISNSTGAGYSGTYVNLTADTPYYIKLYYKAASVTPGGDGIIRGWTSTDGSTWTQFAEYVDNAATEALGRIYLRATTDTSITPHPASFDMIRVSASDINL